MPAGRLYYVVGASGAGKDSVMRYAREALGRDHEVLFARRYITRPLRDGGDDHIALSADDFALRERRGLFAMDWESHGFRYGIGVEIDAWLAQALTVVVNGSRSDLPVARGRYPQLKAVWITARPQNLAARLAQRGRETRAQIVARLKRNARLGSTPAVHEVRISNDGPLEAAGGRFVALLSGERS